MKKLIIVIVLLVTIAVSYYVYYTYPLVEGMKRDLVRRSKQFEISIKESTWSCREGSCLGSGVVRFDGSKNQYIIRTDTVYSCKDSGVCTKKVGIVVDKGPYDLCIKLIDSDEIGCYW